MRPMMSDSTDRRTIEIDPDQLMMTSAYYWNLQAEREAARILRETEPDTEGWGRLPFPTTHDAFTRALELGTFDQTVYDAMFDPRDRRILAKSLESFLSAPDPASYLAALQGE